MRLIAVLSLLVSLGIVGLGFLLASQATSGVGIIAIGIWLAIIGRIAQASAQHEDVMKALQKLDLPIVQPPKAQPPFIHSLAAQPEPQSQPVPDAPGAKE
jgi:hypothetical protein